MRTLLIVDDEADLLKAVRRALHAHDFEVLIAANLEEARGLLRSAVVDAMLIDITLPGHSGVEVASQLAPLCPRAVIAFTSGFDRRTIEAAGIEIGEHPLLEKPLRLTDVEQICRSKE